MTSRPTPPESPQDTRAFEDAVSRNPSEWFHFCQQAYAYMESQDTQIANLSDHITTLDERTASLETKIIEESAANRNLLAQMKDKDIQIIEATVTARLAQQASLPTVRVITPEASGTSPAEETTAPHLGTTPPPAAGSTTSSRLSEKLPDPDKFEGSRSDLRRFLHQVHAEMTANADRLPTTTSRLTYVAGRLTGKAYALILPRTVFGIPQFSDYPELLTYLENAFGDPDRVQNAQNRLHQLRQRHQDFSTYFSEFQRLALEGEMADSNLTPLLFQGISRELQDMLLHNPPPSREFHQYANHLQTLDNRYRQHQQQIQRSQPPRPTLHQNHRQTSPRRGRSPPSHGPPRHTMPAVAPVNDPMDLSNQRRPWGPNRREKNLCFRCGSDSHHIRDCRKPDTRRTQARFAALNNEDLSPARSPDSPALDSRKSTPSPDRTENGVSLP
ncbi:uncharacterized protein J7T54_004871 [Emericellopsis cladophorae]|uniref:CCHC-type domain-containing protein n=1 Tax=Emericellopsis cladophorae TaxID=2686198 RepID=A0A9Q0BAH3_9HYPO|nr:uncharacterized protein J7T54_004871 [Emericellopsis cladophorae]KAI6777575.1 hypothetical protein J7T54_004871 [Emericellopsis cladophorae]